MWFQCPLLQKTQIIDFSLWSIKRTCQCPCASPGNLQRSLLLLRCYISGTEGEVYLRRVMGTQTTESSENNTLMSCEKQLPFYCSGYQGTELPVWGRTGLVMTNNRLLSNSRGAQSTPHRSLAVFFQQSQHTSLCGTQSDKWPHLVIPHSWQHNLWGWASFSKPQGCPGTVDMCVHSSLSQQRHGVNQGRLELMGTDCSGHLLHV